MQLKALQSYIAPRFEWACPLCGNKYMVDVLEFFIATSGGRAMECYDCRTTFEVKIELLDPRSPTLRAPDTQATTEALIEEITDAAFGMLNEKPVDSNNFRRFLRERLGRR